MSRNWSLFCKIIILIIITTILCTIFVGCNFLGEEEDKNTQNVKGERQPKVYITRTGECYHNTNCEYLYSRIPIGLYEAKSRGYRACKVCHGTPSGYIYV